MWIADDADNGGWGACALRFVEGQCVRQFRIPLEIEGGEMRHDLRDVHVTQCLKGGQLWQMNSSEVRMNKNNVFRQRHRNRNYNRPCRRHAT